MTEDQHRNAPVLSTRAPGQVGRYEIICPLAEGGMASVYAARLTGLDGFEKLVAIKLIHPHLSAETRYIQMFLDEAHLAGGVHHPNVGEVYEVGADKGLYFMVAELIKGQSLRGLFARAYTSTVTVPYPLTAHIVAEICRGLHAAHELKDADNNSLGLVHRDVSPRNVLVSYDGCIKLIDFGVAYARGRLTHTEVGMLKGKLGYMSPEQIRGQPLDRRSDLFSLGVVLYELLVGQSPFPGQSDGERMLKCLEGEVVSPRRNNPSIPEALARVALTALASEKRARFATAAQMAAALDAIAGRSLRGKGGQRAVAALMEQLFERERQELGALLGVDRSHPPVAAGSFPVLVTDSRKSTRQQPVVSVSREATQTVGKEGRERDEISRLDFEAIFEKSFARMMESSCETPSASARVGQPDSPPLSHVRAGSIAAFVDAAFLDAARIEDRVLPNAGAEITIELEAPPIVDEALMEPRPLIAPCESARERLDATVSQRVQAATGGKRRKATPAALPKKGRTPPADSGEPSTKRINIQHVRDRNPQEEDKGGRPRRRS